MVENTVKVPRVVPKPKAGAPTQFVMIKNFAGGLGVFLETWDYSLPGRKISIKFNDERAYVGVKHALGVFTTPAALRQMELGYFTFENLDTLISMAEDLGLHVPSSIKEPPITLDKIAKILRAGDKAALELLTSNLTSKLRDDIIVIGTQLYDKLQHGTIDFIERKVGASLKPIKLGD